MSEISTSLAKSKDLMVNFLGKGWSTFAAVAATPFYIRELGIEAYGLIGFYLSLTNIFYVFDFGMGDSLCRESARLISNNKKHQELRNTLRTLEIVYWSFSLLLASSLFASAPLLHSKWLQNTNYSGEKLIYILQLMSISFFFQWPFLFYCKGLLGVQAHTTQNSVLILSSTVRHFGGVACLFLVGASLEVFFYWQIFSTFFQTALALFFLWKKLELFQNKAHFSMKSLRRIWQFSLGMTAISLTIVILTQTDKLLISKLFSLEEFGCYCLAFTVAFALFFFIQPLVNLYFPIFVRLLEEKDIYSLKKTYHHACQLVMLVICPLALILICFSKHLVYWALSDAALAEKTAPIISIVAPGVLLNCIFYMPYHLQIASGSTKIIFYQNILGICAQIFLILIFSRFLPLTGVASFYFVLNAGYLLFTTPRIHHRFLKKEHLKWLLGDFIFPFVAATIPTVIFYRLFKEVNNPVGIFLAIFISYFISLLSITFMLPLTREWIKNAFARKLET